MVVDTYRYNAYGKLLNSTGSDANPFRYGGKFGYYTDANTGLQLAGARWYSPYLIRWMSRDPIHYRGGDNLSAYVMGNPVKYVDPSGLLELEVDFALKYPNSAKRIMSLDRRVSSKKIQAWGKFGQASRKQIFEVLTPHRGPTVCSQNLPGFGKFQPGIGSKDIFIDISLLNGIESGKYSRRLLDATVEHELTHYFDDLDGKDYPGEEGELYETSVYGNVVEK